MIVQILVSAIVIGVALIVLLRMFGMETLTISGRTILLSKPYEKKGEKVSVEDLMWVIIFAALLRAVLYVLGNYLCGFFGDMDQEAIRNAWGNWDGTHYLKLAELGYDGYVENGKHLFLVFFPLYPWLIRLVHLVISDYATCAYLVSNVAYVVGCVYLFRLMAEEFSKNVAWKTIVFLSIFPYAFFYGFIRTESLFLMTTVMTVYYIRKHKFFRAGICGILASLTRLQGVLLILAALAELLVHYKPWKMIREKQWGMLWKEVGRKVLCVPLMAVGTLIYLWVNDRTTGNAFQFLIHQKEHWYQESQWFSKTIQMMMDYLKNNPGSDVSIRIFGPWLVLFVIVLAFMIYAVRRLPVTYMVWFGMFFIMNYMMSWPLSIGRYMTCTVPLFMAMAVAGERHEGLERWMMIISGVLLGFMTVACLRGLSIY